MTGQEVLLAGDGDEIQFELARSHLDAEADIGHTAGDEGSYRRMGKLLILIDQSLRLRPQPATVLADGALAQSPLGDVKPCQITVLMA